MALRERVIAALTMKEFGRVPRFQGTINAKGSWTDEWGFTGVVAECPGGKGILPPAIRTTYGQWNHIQKDNLKY